jgi:hypothetical protein
MFDGFEQLARVQQCSAARSQAKSKRASLLLLYSPLSTVNNVLKPQMIETQAGLLLLAHLYALC